MAEPDPQPLHACHLTYVLRTICGLGSSVGIATELRAGRSGIESRWGRDFPPVQTGPGAHPNFCKMRTGSFLGVKCGRGVLLTTHPLLVPRSWKSRARHLPTLWATPGLSRDHFTSNFTFYYELSPINSQTVSCLKYCMYFFKYVSSLLEVSPILAC